jgi:hypothetical protein
MQEGLNQPSRFTANFCRGPRLLAAPPTLLGVSSMKSIAIPLMLTAAIGLTGCGTTTGERAGSGALMGAAGGALIGSLTASAGEGALIGAGVGALGGYLYDQHKKGYID